MAFKSLPELLAPAGSIDSLKAAVNAGADAVYLSGKNFGARYYAENFSELEMVEALNYAHLHGLKVYVTVNTLVKDLELEKIAEYLLWLYKIGADAVILQDVGVASICRELVPDLDMHASTQMNINSLEGVKWAYLFGFKRVILSRELNLKEIEEIADQMSNKIELEIFAHGALCYCYSGQCLLSSVIGGRSGNRGRCAQPCRKPYQLLNGNKDKFGKLIDPVQVPLKENYLLSTHDLALYKNLDQISNLAVNSLKLEGRMRSPEYVALVVGIYRKALDSIMNRKKELISEDKVKSWVPDDEDLFKLKLAFNRGFSCGYLLETNKELIMGREASGNRGVFLGTVKGYGKENYRGNRSILIHLDKKLNGLKNRFKLEKGDGIVFIRPDKREYGMVLKETPEYLNKQLTKIFLKIDAHIPTGSEVYLTRDVSLINKTKDIIHSQKNEISIPLDTWLEWDESNVPLLKGQFKGIKGKIYNISLKGNFEMEPALKSPLSKDQIINQLKKTGGTYFRIRKIEIDYPGNLFVPLSKLNKFRRDFIKKAESKLLDDFKPPVKCVEAAEERMFKIMPDLKSCKINEKTGKSTALNLDLAVYTSSLETIKGALKGGCRLIYFEPFLWEYHHRKKPCEVIDWKIYVDMIQELLLKAQKLCKTEQAVLVWKWPSINRNSFLKNLLPLVNPLFHEGLQEIMVDNIGAIRAINKLNPHIILSGSAGLNIWNHKTVNEFSKLLNSITLSNELSKAELASTITNFEKSNTKTSFEFLVQGNLESMVSEDCLLSIISQEKQELSGEVWGIRDVKKRVFPLLIDDENRTYILNSVELCLIDYLPELYEIGVNRLIIDARGKTEDYANSMVMLYNQGLKQVQKDVGNRNYLNILKNKVRKMSMGGITTGNFKRELF